MKTDFNVNLPGYKANCFRGSDFHKPQRFVFRNGVALEEKEKGAECCLTRKLVGREVFVNEQAPVLTFSACYRDPLGEGDRATAMFRKCNVIYFLEDDEIKIYEPHQKNSGLPQGCIVAKGKLPKPEGGFYTLCDLNLRESLFANGREFRLTNCDPFTSRFMAEMGYRLNPPLQDVIDPITEDRKEMNSLHSYRQPHAKSQKAANFLKNHPKKLRFFGSCGDESDLFEDPREVTLYFDLADASVKVVEERDTQGTDGRSDTPVLLKPTRVPKVYEPSLLAGEMADPTILNLAHDEKNVLIGGKYYTIVNPSAGLPDSNPVVGRRKEVDYYAAKDLKLGVPLRIFGFRIVLYDCDEFTKNYYKAIHNRDVVPAPRPYRAAHRSHKLVYAGDGLGPEEQTIRTNDPFEPKRYSADVHKFFKYARYGYDVQELKFLARIVSDNPAENSRLFVICWMMEDDTMSIKAMDAIHPDLSKMELQRKKVTKPRSVYGNSGRCFYQSADMYVGNVLYVRCRPYLLLEADEYTYDYMEKHCERFPLADVRKIMTELKEWVPSKSGDLEASFQQHDAGGTGYIPYENFRDVLYCQMPHEYRARCPEHCAKTAGRYYAELEYTGLLLSDLVRTTQTELYRKRYSDFDDLRLAFRMHDPDTVGCLRPDRVYYVIRAANLPLSRDLIKSLIYKFPKEQNKVNYEDLIKAIDWMQNPNQYDKAEAKEIQINWQRIETERNMNKIKYKCFITDLCES